MTPLDEYCAAREEMRTVKPGRVENELFERVNMLFEKLSDEDIQELVRRQKAKR